VIYFIERITLNVCGVLNYAHLKEVIRGQDIVCVNLAGDLGAMAKNIVKAMEETGVKRIIAISPIGIYDAPLRSVLKTLEEVS
jgi:hypothetical protein